MTKITEAELNEAAQAYLDNHETGPNSVSLTGLHAAISAYMARFVDSDELIREQQDKIIALENRQVALVKNLEGTAKANESLRAEVGTLRSDVDGWRYSCQRWDADFRRVRDENLRLRLAPVEVHRNDAAVPETLTVEDAGRTIQALRDKIERCIGPGGLIKISDTEGMSAELAAETIRRFREQLSRPASYGTVRIPVRDDSQPVNLEDGRAAYPRPLLRVEELSAAQAAQAIVDLRSQVVELNRRTAELRRRIEAYDSAHNDFVKTINDQRNSLRQKNEALTQFGEALAESRTAVIKADDEAAEARRAHAQVCRTVEKLTAELRANRVGTITLARAYDCLSDAKAQADSTLDRVVEERNNLRSAGEKLFSERERLATKVNELASRVDALRTENAGLQNLQAIRVGFRDGSYHDYTPAQAMRTIRAQADILSDLEKSNAAQAQRIHQLEMAVGNPPAFIRFPRADGGAVDLTAAETVEWLEGTKRERDDAREALDRANSAIRALERERDGDREAVRQVSESRRAAISELDALRTRLTTLRKGLAILRKDAEALQ